MSRPSAPSEAPARPAASDQTPQRQSAVERAWAKIDETRLLDLVAAMVSIPSPTGDERALAEFLTRHLAAAGLVASYQQIDDRQGNAVGRLAGDGTGADLLLYAPIDTLTVGTQAEDLSYVGACLRPDLRPQAVVEGDRVVGLGASNPKGHAACVVAAAEAVAAADVSLRGSLLVGLGAGGMPTNRRDGYVERANTGQGNGCSFMLEQGVQGDHAILAKPGWSVSWEEVGLCWFTVRVFGTYNYVGSRQRLPYHNAVVDAARLIGELERWFPEYTARHTSGLVAPQGQVASVRGGWQRTAAICPAVCEFTVDLRISPRTRPVQAHREFVAAVAEASQRLGIESSCEMTLSIPGSSTPTDCWIVQSCIRAWEQVTGDRHEIDEVARTTSGATDGNILRNRGIPTARIGMPRVADPGGAEVDFPMGMNAVSVPNMVRLTRLLVAAAIDACTRQREEIGA